MENLLFFFSNKKKMITEGKINYKQDFREYFLGNFLFLSSKKKKEKKKANTSLDI